MRVVSKEERERGDFGRAMGNGVVLEFSGSKELGPLVGVVGTEDTEIGFYFLIGSFGLSVSLWMVGSGKTNIIFKESSKFSGKCRGELRSSVGDESVMESKAFEHVIKKELGNTVYINSLRTRG